MSGNSGWLQALGDGHAHMLLWQQPSDWCCNPPWTLPSPSTFVSTARLQLIWRMPLCDSSFCPRNEKELVVKSLLCLLTCDVPPFPKELLEVNQAETIQSSVGSCCAIINLSSDIFIPFLCRRVSTIKFPKAALMFLVICEGLKGSVVAWVYYTRCVFLCLTYSFRRK